MRNFIAFVLALAFVSSASAAASKTPLDLMLEGRFKEAKQILDKTKVSPRYQLAYFAMIEADAARACSLYQVIAIRYPKSDCDSVARSRLDQAQDMGFMVIPIAEWAEAPRAAKPLELHRPPAQTQAETPPVETEASSAENAVAAAEPPVESAPVSTSSPIGAAPASSSPIILPIPIGNPQPESNSAQAETKLESVKDSPAESEAAAPPPQDVTADEPAVKDIVDNPIAVPLKPEISEPAPQPEAKPSVKDVVIAPPKSEPQSENIVKETPTVESVKETMIAGDEQSVEPSKPAVHDVKIEPPAAPPVETKPVPIAEVKPEAGSAVKSTPVVPEPKMQEVAPAKIETEELPVEDHPKTNGGHWYIQVGAFGNFDNAHNLAKKLQKDGFPVKLVMRENAARKLLQVRVGGYPTKESLDSIKEQLKSQYNLPTVVLSD